MLHKLPQACPNSRRGAGDRQQLVDRPAQGGHRREDESKEWDDRQGKRDRQQRDGRGTERCHRRGDVRRGGRALRAGGDRRACWHFGTGSFPVTWNISEDLLGMGFQPKLAGLIRV